MPLRQVRSRLRRIAALNVRVPAGLIDCRNVAWDGHDLVVVSRFDVLRD